jgi:fermentation-respiration switch protein FrsA (DUF1100 family)
MRPASVPRLHRAALALAFVLTALPCRGHAEAGAMLLPTAVLPDPAALVVARATAPADTLDGRWLGRLRVQAGIELRIVVHLTSADGGWTATLDSPDQGVTGIAVDRVVVDGARVTLEMPGILARYEARRASADTLDGTWSQGGMSLPLVLVRQTGEPEDERPQHPRPPFPYRVEEVRFPNDEAGIHLAGTLTLPEGSGPFPAAALITGSGPQDRDETILGHKPFLVLADHLTRAGIAVLRYDDRGVGQSEGDFAAATSIDFAGDAAAAVDFLRAHPAIDPARVGLIGHSEGGLIAPLVATGEAGAQQRDLAFVVLLAGPGLTGREILYLQGEAIARAAGASDADVAQLRATQSRMFDIVAEEGDAGRRRERLRTALSDGLAAMDSAARAAQGVPPGGERVWVEAQLAQVGSEWFRTFLLYDPRPALARLETPVLALIGGLDLQVPPAENLAAIGEALERAGNRDATLLELPGLNHLFQTATTGAPAEYATIRETFAPAALDAVSSWILERFGRPRS